MKAWVFTHAPCMGTHAGTHVHKHAHTNAHTHACTLFHTHACTYAGHVPVSDLPPLVPKETTLDPAASRHRPSCRVLLF